MIAQRPLRRMTFHQPPCSQNAVGIDDLVRRGSNVHTCIVQDEILDMDQFSIDPKRGNGIVEVLSLQKSVSDRRSADSFIETRQSLASPRQGLQEPCGFQ